MKQIINTIAFVCYCIMMGGPLDAQTQTPPPRLWQNPSDHKWYTSTPSVVDGQIHTRWDILHIDPVFWNIQRWTYDFHNHYEDTISPTTAILYMLDKKNVSHESITELPDPAWWYIKDVHQHTIRTPQLHAQNITITKTAYTDTQWISTLLINACILLWLFWGMWSIPITTALCSRYCSRSHNLEIYRVMLWIVLFMSIYWITNNPLWISMTIAWIVSAIRAFFFPGQFGMGFAISMRKKMGYAIPQKHVAKARSASNASILPDFTTRLLE